MNEGYNSNIDYRITHLVNQIDDLRKEVKEIKQSISKETKVENSKWEWWHPLEGEVYFFNREDGMSIYNVWRNMSIDIYRRNVFNIYRSGVEAKEFQHLGTYQRKWAMILKELNPPGWKPDWNNRRMNKYYATIYHSESSGKIEFKFEVNSWIHIHHNMMYAATSEICLKAIELMGDDIYKMFGVEKS